MENLMVRRNCTSQIILTVRYNFETLYGTIEPYLSAVRPEPSV